MLAGCTVEPVVFDCEGDHSKCGVGGRCETTSTCSVPDDNCPGGLRHARSSEPDLAGRCLEVTNDDQPLRALSAGARHTCAITGPNTGKNLYCWGEDQELNRPGSSLVPARTYPKETYPFEFWSQVAVGTNHTCALTTLGAVYCWQNNKDPTQITLGFDLNPAEPVTMSAGDGHTCLLGTDSEGLRRLVCWGNNDAKQLGTNDSSVSLNHVTGYGEIQAVSAGDRRTCIVHRTDKVSCFGEPLDGAPIPMPIDSVAPGAITASYDHVCWTEGPEQTVRCLPTNHEPQESVNATLLANGRNHTCAYSQQTTKLKCWDTMGTTSTEVDLGLLRFLTAGEAHTCFTTTGESGSLVCWGANAEGQLGLGNKLPQPEPTTTAVLPFYL